MTAQKNATQGAQQQIRGYAAKTPLSCASFSTQRNKLNRLGSPHRDDAQNQQRVMTLPAEDHNMSNYISQMLPGAKWPHGHLGGMNTSTGLLQGHQTSAAQSNNVSHVNYSTHSNQQELSRAQSKDDDPSGIRANHPIGTALGG